jgi:hypothetical protein
VDNDPVGLYRCPVDNEYTQQTREVDGTTAGGVAAEVLVICTRCGTLKNTELHL